MTQTPTYIGASVRRKEDVRFTTGRAQFVDDIKLLNMLHASVVRSPHAHARIKAIDTSKALAIPGVVAVFTYPDIEHLAKPIPLRAYSLAVPGLEPFFQKPLPSDKVRYVGEPVALVVAESRALAEDGVDAVEVTYEPLTPVMDVLESLEGKVLIHEDQGTNEAAQYTIDEGDIDSAFREADYTRKERFKVHRHTGNPLETRGLVASYEPGRGELTVWGPTKVVHHNRGILASMLNMQEQSIHFIEPDVGGGFGIRGEFYPEDFLIPFAAMKVGRPVKWIEDRLEHLVGSNHSRELLCDIEIATKRDGQILGIRAEVYGVMGAFVRTHGTVIPSATAAVLTGPYHVPNYHCVVHCVLTNKMGLGTYRAPGRYESCFIRERLLDMVATDLKIDPAELRLKNLVQPSQMPYSLGKMRPPYASTVLDSGDYPLALTEALDRIGYEGLKDLQGTYRDGKCHGIGMACFVKISGTGPFEGARIVIKRADEIAVYSGVATMGQGHETAMAQICADGLGVPIEAISFYHGNTDYIPYGAGTSASRVTVMLGNAIYLACHDMKTRILSLAGKYLGIDPQDLIFERSGIYRKEAEGEGPLLGLDDVVQLADPSNLSAEGTPGLDVTSYYKSEHQTVSYGSHVCHVAVDPETGKLEILRYVVTEDVGRAINPMMVHGQCIGAAVQGIGGTILEELVYDDGGQLISGSFMDYLLPTSTDVPHIESIVMEIAPSPFNPLGVKGAGEGGIVATGAALANAVTNALRPLGVEVRGLPLSPDKILALIRAGHQG